eukprot:48477_1
MFVPPPIFATPPKEHVAFNPLRSSPGSFNMDSSSQSGNMQSYNSCEPLDLPDLNAPVTPNQANGTPGTDKYKKRKQRNRTHRKHHCTASEKREKKNLRKLHKQQKEIECNKEQIHKLKQKNQHLHKTQNLIESDLCAILDEYECQIGNDWTAIETEEQRYWDENDGFEQMRMNLKIMECACKTDIAHKQISDHLKRQCILDGKTTTHVPSSSTIRRYILYRLCHVIGLVVALIIYNIISGATLNEGKKQTNPQRRRNSH